MNIVLRKYLQTNINKAKKTRLFFSQAKSVQNNALYILYQHSVNNRTPYFEIASHHIKIIDDPLDFYVTIQKQIAKATFRIGLSSLYLGTGPLERAILKNIVKRVQKMSNFEVLMLFDYNRSMREEKGESSIEMMNHYINPDQNSKIKIAFNKQAQSFNKVLGEIKGVHHQKIAIFDDTIIIGGANLSHNYFLNRKDRYLKFKQSPQFSDFLFDYLRVMVENCDQLSTKNKPIQPDNPNLDKHYKLWKFAYEAEQYKTTFFQQQSYLSQIRTQKYAEQKRKIIGSEKKSIPISKNLQVSENLGTQIKEFTAFDLQQRQKIRQKIRSRLFQTASEDDVNNQLIEIHQMGEDSQLIERGQKVYIFPFIHHPKLKQTNQPKVLVDLLEASVKSDLQIKISSGYMNFTDNILSVLKQAKKQTVILCSSPEANSFYRGGAFKKYIPYFYRCFEGKILQKWPTKFKIMEYFNGKWSFHAKGLWIQENDESFLTVLGSSNFNRRSSERDTELQVYLYSTCPRFNFQLKQQWKNLQKDCKEVTLQVIKKDPEIKYSFFSQIFSKLFSKFL